MFAVPVTSGIALALTHVDSKVTAMEEAQLEKTVALKACVACDAGLLERDRFCRWCGTHQPARTAATLEASNDIALAVIPATSVLAPATRAEVYRRVSGPLVDAVVTGALSGEARENQSRFIKRVTLALITIPIWLIIVLLSPLDAYAAVKNLARQS